MEATEKQKVARPKKKAAPLTPPVDITPTADIIPTADVIAADLPEKKTTALAISLLPTAELEAINATEAGLARLHEQALKLKERGVPTTKEHAKEVHDFTQMAVKVRTHSLALAETEAAPYKEKANSIMAEGKRIGLEAKKSEDLTRPLKDAWDDQAQAEAERKKTEAAAKLQQRTLTVINLGMEWDGVSTYALGPHIIEGVEVVSAPDAEWDQLIMAVTTYRTEELNRIKQQQADDEAKRVADETALEEQRLEQKKRQDQLDADAKKLQDDIDEFNRQKAATENERLQAVADENRRLEKFESDRLALRLKRLTNIGAITSNESLGITGYWQPIATLKTIDDLSFEAVCEDMKEAVDAETIRLADEKQRQDAADVQAAQELVDDNKRKEQEDAERQNRLASDRDLLSSYLDQFGTSLTVPEPREPESAFILADFQLRLGLLISEYTQEFQTY